MDKEIEKELAVLKGRVDGLEAQVNELWYKTRVGFRASFLDVIEYDISLKSQNPISGKFGKIFWGTFGGGRVGWLQSEDAVGMISMNELVLMEEKRDDGKYPTVNVTYYGDTSTTGKDLVTGAGEMRNSSEFQNWGLCYTPQGNKIVITKQKIK